MGTRRKDKESTKEKFGDIKYFLLYVRQMFLIFMSLKNKYNEVGGKYIMTGKRENPKQEKRNKAVQFIVSRGFAGGQTMQEAFEQLIERQACERFDKKRERKAG